MANALNPSMWEIKAEASGSLSVQSQPELFSETVSKQTKIGNSEEPSLRLTVRVICTYVSTRTCPHKTRKCLVYSS